MQKLTIVAIGRETTNIEISKIIFERQDHTVLLASPEEGLELVLKSNPDVVLFEQGFPRNDDWKWITHLRANPISQDVPVIYMSIYAKSGDLERFRNAGYDEILILPKNSDLVETVNTIIKRKRDE